MEFSEANVLALSPDAASAKAAKGLQKISQWPRLGQTEEALWGECQGSGSKPYQTQIDLRSTGNPTFKCSCPSRKFPCKHGLALMLLKANQPAQFTDPTPPPWVQEWLDARTQRAEKKEEKKAQEAQLAQDPQAQAAQLEAKRKQAEKTIQKRWSGIDVGVQEFQRWLQDTIQNGLGVLQPQHQSQWQTQAARLVDAKAPSLARRIHDGLEWTEFKPQWQRELLGRLGQMHLMGQAIAQRSQLNADELGDLRQLVIGWPLDQTALLQDADATGRRFRDDWWVLGQVKQEQDRLTERRVWLWGLNTKRYVLLLDHVYGDVVFPRMWMTGTVVHGDVVYYPSRAPLRGQMLDNTDLPPPPTPHPPPPSTEERAWWIYQAQGDLGDAAIWKDMAHRLAVCPWLWQHPLWVQNAHLHWLEGQFWVTMGGRRIRLGLAEEQALALLALSKGQSLWMTAEWNHKTLLPLWAASEQGETWHL